MLKKIGYIARRFVGFLFLYLFFPLLGLIVTGALVILAYINFWHRDLGPKELNYFLNLKPPLLTEILDSEGKKLIDLPGIENWQTRSPNYRKLVSYEKIPPIIIEALLSAEDQRFFEHHGIDYRAVVRALVAIWKESSVKSVKSVRPRIVFTEGGSTITQQDVKLIFLREEMEEEWQGEATRLDKMRRKIEEARISIWLEKVLAQRLGSKELAKKKILEVFANFTYFGHGRYGVAAAYEFYFGQSLSSSVKETEAATLAGLIQNPSHYSPYNNPPASVSRRNKILALMTEHGFVDSRRLSELQKTTLGVVIQPSSPTSAPGVVEFVLETLWGIPHSNIIRWQEGVTVKTTVYFPWQIAANQALEDGLDLYRQRHPEYADKIQGAIVVLQNSGKILAMVSGSGTTYTSYNRATGGIGRQPGSAFKPFVYVTALEKGWGLDCLEPLSRSCYILDYPIRVPMGAGRPPHEIHNYDGRFLGRIQLWQGLAESRNAATVWLSRQLGIESIVDTANRLGLNQSIERFPTTAIGASEVTPLELAAAFMVFANGGILVRPYTIEEVINKDGTVQKIIPKEEIVLDEEIADQMAEALRHTIVWPHGTARRLAGLPFQVGGKTGTTNDFRDAWFCGFTYGEDGVTICIWVGMDDNTPLGDSELCRPLGPIGKDFCEPGGRVALPIFEKLIQEIYKDGEPEPFPEEMEDRIREAEKFGVVRR